MRRRRLQRLFSVDCNVQRASIEQCQSFLRLEEETMDCFYPLILHLAILHLVFQKFLIELRAMSAVIRLCQLNTLTFKFQPNNFESLLVHCNT